MIIDLILNRKENEMYNDSRKYRAENFYFDVLQYRDLTPEDSDNITRAMDSGTEQDVKRELARYIVNHNYNLDIINYINSVNWIE